MTDILLGQSYFLRFDPKLWAAMQPYPPLGTLFAAALLRQRGYDVALFDAMLAPAEQAWDEALARHTPRFAALFEDSFNYLSKMCLLRMRQAAFTMIRMARARGTTVIVCGSDASDHAADYLDAGAHFVLNGEGDATLAALLDHLSGRDDTPLETINGLTLGADAPGRTTPRDEPLRTPPRPVLRDLDALPAPAWDLVDVAHYRRLWQERHGYFSMNMVTTRGCPYHCNWCAKPIWGQTYHMRSPAHVAAELATLKAHYQPDHIWFADDIMGLKRGWMATFADEVEANGARTPFKALSRADLLLRPGEVEALRRAGCQTVWIGAESGSQKILDAMEKGTTVEQIHQATERVRAAGIAIGFFLQFGYPGESRADIERTRTMVRTCQPDEIGMSVSYPLPGTPFHARVEHELGSQRNWVDSEDLAMMYRGPFSTDFYRQLHRVMAKEFRALQAGRMLRAAVQQPRTLRLRHLRKAAALCFHRLTLPLAQRRLETQARVPHRGMAPLAAGLSHEEAATPTPQSEA